MTTPKQPATEAGPAAEIRLVQVMLGEAIAQRRPLDMGAMIEAQRRLNRASKAIKPMTTPKQPATEDLIEALVKSHPLNAPCGVSNADLYERAKAIAAAARAEAAAGLLALREAATAARNALRSVPSADMPDALLNVEKWLDKALAAPAAAEIEARIRAEGFGAAMDQAALHYGEALRLAVPHWLNSPAPAVLMADANLPEAEIMRALRALRREQPATEGTE